MGLRLGSKYIDALYACASAAWRREDWEDNFTSKLNIFTFVNHIILSSHVQIVHVHCAC